MEKSWVVAGIVVPLQTLEVQGQAITQKNWETPTNKAWQLLDVPGVEATLYVQASYVVGDCQLERIGHSFMSAVVVKEPLIASGFQLQCHKEVKRKRRQR